MNIKIYLITFLMINLLIKNSQTLAQLTKDQEKTVKTTVKNYTSLLQRLGQDHNDIEAFESLASEVFVSGARVYDDFLDGEVMDEFIVYLGKIRDYRGQLKLSFNDFHYYYKRQHGINFGIVQIVKSVQLPRYKYDVINHLAINADNGKLTEITKTAPSNILPFGKKEIIYPLETNKRYEKKINDVDNSQTSEVENDLPVIEMVFVQGGNFKMGSDKYVDSKPLHDVYINDFYMGKYEVTQAEWVKIMGTNPSYFKDCPDCPVERVSWNEITEFLKKLNFVTKEEYRLPTEAEWEYVARGGSKEFDYNYAGSNSLEEVACYKNNSFDKGKNHSDYGTNTVGDKKPNQLGIYDMSGNVFEWCSDWYDNNYNFIVSRMNPKGPSNGLYKVIRGGSWSHSSLYCEVGKRHKFEPDKKSSTIGFRLCKSL